jgi:2'-5' RNA ligase
MSPFPERMSDHWWQRPGRRPGRVQYHWHMLFHDQPAVGDLAEAAQRKLAGLPGLDLVARQWLHLTTLVVGFADEVSGRQLTAITRQAERRLARVPPIPVTLGRVYYHPEAIVLIVDPAGALTPVLEAVQAATALAGCAGQTDTDPWVPHVTVAYSHEAQPAGPYVAALGTRVPETAITIRSVSLVAQTQVGRSWQWDPVAEIRLSGAA